MPRRVLKGTVVSAGNNKTVVVNVVRAFKHPLYGKTIRTSKKYHAHDESNQFQLGDEVRIIECKPHSKLKRWEVMTNDAQAQA